MSVFDSIAQRIEEQPIPSMIAFELLKVIEDENHSLKEVVALVETDASLTTEVLKVANSATYYRGQPVTTIKHAVLLLGEMMVVGVAICASSSIVFNSPLEGYDSGEGEMWEHSLRTAIAARELSRYATKNVSPGLAFTAGLLHDIGKSVISEFLVGSTGEMTEACHHGDVVDFLEAEHKLLGTDHAKVGYALAQHWGLPRQLCVAIRNHHMPSQAEAKDRPLVFVVHLADLVSMIGGCGTGSDTLAYRVDNDYEQYVKLEKNELDIVLLKIQEDFVCIKQSIIG